MFKLKYIHILIIMAPIGQVRTHGFQGHMDFKYLKNVPKFAEEVSTNLNIINEVNRATSKENELNIKINNLKLDIQDVFGGTFSEIKEVYGNLGNVHEKLDNINQLNRLTPQSNNNLQNQILTSRINNVEQLLLNLQK